MEGVSGLLKNVHLLFVEFVIGGIVPVVTFFVLVEKEA
jgi:hypothetical protein